ncbi:MAG: hypothetical protein WC303_01460 [Candidatus Paceibacterota bacterium]|jgi:hypothetical protein
MLKGLFERRWFFVIIITILILIGIVLAFQYDCFFKENNQINLSQSNIENETIDWETYTNQIHNFEIKYPKEWMLQKEVGFPPATIIGHRWDDNGYCSLNILIVSNGTDSNFEMDWYRQHGYKEEVCIVDELPGIKFSKFPVENSAPVGVIYFNNTSNRIDMVASMDKYQSCMVIFEKMLDTFKFPMN